MKFGIKPGDSRPVNSEISERVYFRGYGEITLSFTGVGKNLAKIFEFTVYDTESPLGAQWLSGIEHDTNRIAFILQLSRDM